MKALSREYRGSFADVYLKGGFQWQVSYFTQNGKKEIGLVIIDDLSGRVVEQWTGFQVAWTMARGYPGAFGRHVNALYIWLPMCVLFLLPFFDFRRPFSLLHLDLLMLLSFSVSLAFFNHAQHLGLGAAGLPAAAVPAGADARAAATPIRPPLAREAAAAAAPARARAVAGARRGVPDRLSHRAQRHRLERDRRRLRGRHRRQQIVHGKPLYGGYPSDNEHGDTYGPVNYEAYVPFEQIFGWSGTWDDLPAAHAAAIIFDLLAVALLFLLGRRMRGPTLGVALAYAWVAYPFTLFALESNSNDTLVAVLVLAALLAASYRSKLAPAAPRRVRGAGRPDQVRPAGAGAAAGHARAGASCRSPRRAARWRSSLLAFARRRRARRRSPRSATTRCTRSTSARSPTRPSAARRSPSGGSTAGTGLERVVEIAAVVLAIALAVVPRARTSSAWRPRARWSMHRRRSSASNTGSTCTSPGSSRSSIVALLGRFSDPVGSCAGRGISTCSIESARSGC